MPRKPSTAGNVDRRCSSAPKSEILMPESLRTQSPKFEMHEAGKTLGAGVSPTLQVRKESEIPTPESPLSQNLKTLKALKCCESRQRPAGVSPKLQVRKESEIPMPESPQSQNLKTLKALKCLESRQRPEIVDRRGRGVAKIASPEGVRHPDARKSSISKPQNPQGPQMLRKPSTASRGVAKIASPEGLRNPDARTSSISKPQNPQGPQMPRKPSTA